MQVEEKIRNLYTYQGIGIGLLSAALAKYIFVDYLKDTTINGLTIIILIVGVGMTMISVYFIKKKGGN